MGKVAKGWLKKLVDHVVGLLVAEIKKPLEEIRQEQTRQAEELKALRESIRQRHSHDAEDLECDLSSLDNQICQQIELCRMRGYTTASDRRRVTRMHAAYKARGGNHGEEAEYAIFLQLPTEEAYFNAL